MFTPRPNLSYVTVELNLTGLPNYTLRIYAATLDRLRVGLNMYLVSIEDA